MLPTPSSSRILQWLVHRFLFFMFNLQNAFLTFFGKIDFPVIGRVQNSIPFTVVADPNSVYLNFRIKPEQLEAFIAYINLPAEFTVCPIQCLDNEEPEYLLTANIYEVTGLAKGLRCEWSTYVLDEDGIARYMVLEARSSKKSMDPISVITPRGHVEHCRRDDKVISEIASNDGKLFRSTITLNPDAPYIRPYGDWVEANDYIYWRNGMRDRAYYSAGLSNPKVRLINFSDVTINDETHWAPFIIAEPKHTMVFENSIDFNIVMWDNL